jgi:AbrB family looped-hinge helix DNA binding protein
MVDGAAWMKWESSAMMVSARVSSKNRIAIPVRIRQRLSLSPGDRVIFRETEDGVRIERAPAEEYPFGAFSEWASDADHEAYADLRIPTSHGPKVTGA